MMGNISLWSALPHSGKSDEIDTWFYFCFYTYSCGIN